MNFDISINGTESYEFFSTTLIKTHTHTHLIFKLIFNTMQAGCLSTSLTYLQDILGNSFSSICSYVFNETYPELLNDVAVVVQAKLWRQKDSKCTFTSH